MEQSKTCPRPVQATILWLCTDISLDFLSQELWGQESTHYTLSTVLPEQYSMLCTESQVGISVRGNNEENVIAVRAQINY